MLNISRLSHKQQHPRPLKSLNLLHRQARAYACCAYCRSSQPKENLLLPKLELAVAQRLPLQRLRQQFLQALQQGRSNRTGEKQECQNLPLQCLSENSSKYVLHKESSNVPAQIQYCLLALTPTGQHTQSLISCSWQLNSIVHACPKGKVQPG